MTASQFRPRTKRRNRVRHSSSDINPIQLAAITLWLAKLVSTYKDKHISCGRHPPRSHVDRRQIAMGSCTKSCALPGTVLSDPAVAAPQHAVSAFLRPKIPSSLPVARDSQSLVVHRFSLAWQQHLQPSIAEARLLLRQLSQLCAQRFGRPHRLIAVTRFGHYHQAIRPPQAEGHYPSRTCSTAAFSATSSTRFFESSTAKHPCPDSGPIPTSAVACFHPSTASLPEPGSRPSCRTLPSRRRSCASTRPLLSPRPPPSVMFPVASTPQSSAPRCACSSTSTSPFPLCEIILSFARKIDSCSGGLVVSENKH